MSETVSNVPEIGTAKPKKAIVERTHPDQQ
jgi:hypothetical protein